MSRGYPLGFRMYAATAVTGVLLTVSLAGGPAATPAPGGPRYEVWVIDQADAARGGARLYIYEGRRLEGGGTVTPEVVDLDAAARGVGDGPGVRPHMVEFDPTFTHAIISNVASGHVYVMRAQDRRIVASIDVGEQAHHAMASPDGRLIVVANQGGRRLARVRADFAAERFTYDRGEDLNLGVLEEPAHPDNRPICPVLHGRKVYVTLFGGGLYVVDYTSTPMRVLRAYGRDQVAPAGCGGMVVGDRIYVNSGTATSSDLYVFDAASDVLRRHLRLGWSGADGHGMVAVGGAGAAMHAGHSMGGAGARFLWMGNRASGNVVILSTAVDAFAGVIEGVGAAPDIMGISPDGRHVYVVLRGPNNLTGGPPAKGETPGVAVLEVLGEGRSGRRIAFHPIGDQTPGSPNDPHGLAVRLVRP
jgi:DNA-binding beta-propeller fold protein YncE